MNTTCQTMGGMGGRGGMSGRSAGKTAGKSRARGSALSMTLAGVALATASLLALVETSSSSQSYTNGFVDDQTAN